MTNGGKNDVSSFRLRHSFVLRHSDFVSKKVPPPTPDGREGRLFPPEQSSKTLRLLNELQAGRNNFFIKKFRAIAGPRQWAKTRRSFNKIISSPNEVKRRRANRRAR